MKTNALKIIMTVLLALALTVASFLGIVLFWKNDEQPSATKPQEPAGQNIQAVPPEEVIPEILSIERVLSGHDEDGDGIDDFDDILAGARKDAENRPSYRSEYYRGGYPPESEGVCTDVVWRAFMEAGYVLKDMMDKDISKNANSYRRVVESGGPDPNIDFRRVPNQAVFFSKYAKSLTIEITPGNIENLKEWQGGDIVMFTGGIDHVAIVSDKRRPDGVPYIIHNAGPYTKEEDALLRWHEISSISHHFRWVKE